ncbi:hypothetical protein ALT785_770120 [Alteromonas infernus]
MFGTYRLILAFMVVFLHLAGWPGFGEYAVFTFFLFKRLFDDFYYAAKLWL